MTYPDSDLIVELKFIKDYQKNRTHNMRRPIEAEDFDTATDTIPPTPSSQSGISFAFGMIAILSVLSIFQLYHSLEVTPAHPEIIQSTELFTLDSQ